MAEPLTFAQYQEAAGKTAVYPRQGENLLYPILGLLGEVGELANKLKRQYRDDDGILTQARRDELLCEAGDALWYLAMVARELGTTVEEIARRNLAKLADRQARGALHGAGDNR